MTKLSPSTIPDGAAEILATLTGAGHTALLVGGAVRDIVACGAVAPTSDCDITTSATPDETAAAFSHLRVVATGLKHGTVTVINKEGIPYEITTFRTEGGYSDGRHPDNVAFVRTPEEDLSRRDFTVNAMALDLEGNLIDLFGGEDDLSAGLLRAVGEPTRRFTEDPLRILRGLRFASKLGFAFEKDTLAAAERLASAVTRVSGERVREELRGLLCGKWATKTICEHKAVLSAAVPELGDLSKFDPTVLERLPDGFCLRLAALAHAASDPEGLIRRLRLDRETARLTRLVINEASDLPVLPTDEDGSVQKEPLLKLMKKFGWSDARALLRFRAAYSRGFLQMSAFLGAASGVEALRDSGAVYSVSSLAVGGKELAQMGYPPSPQMGELLSALVDAVIEGKVENTADSLIKYILENFSL